MISWRIDLMNLFSAFTEDDNKARLDSDEEKGEDDEDEEHWRRTRHEREQYLLEHKVSKMNILFTKTTTTETTKLLFLYTFASANCRAFL